MNWDFSDNRIRNSLLISMALNCAMAVFGMISNLIKPLKFLGWISNVIARPPGLILRLVLRPDGHSVAAFALAAGEALLGSIVFYTLVAWAALWLISRLRNTDREQDVA